jgi:hypothetical protein
MPPPTHYSTYCKTFVKWFTSTDLAATGGGWTYRTILPFVNTQPLLHNRQPLRVLLIQH